MSIADIRYSIVDKVVSIVSTVDIGVDEVVLVFTGASGLNEVFFYFLLWN